MVTRNDFDSAAQARFWSKVDKNGQAPAHRPALGACWIWTAGADSLGYGRFKSGGRLRICSRVAYALHYGELDDVAFVLHRCDTPRCVNPAHLFLGTQADNMADRRNKERHCPGARNGRSKVSESDVRRIREWHGSGLSKAEIGRRVGISATMVRYIVNRQNWTHVA